jgi:hypothetical protein
MRITVGQLKSIISEAVAKRPAPKRGPKPQGVTVETMPRTLNDYCKWLAGIAKQAGAPDDLVHDIESEGSGVQDAVWHAWDDVGFYLNDERNDEEALEALLSGVHDCMIEIVSEFNDAWNYAPGHKGTKVNASSLAQRADAIASGERPPEYERSKHEMLDAAHLQQGVLTALKAAGVKARDDAKRATKTSRGIIVSKPTTGTVPTAGKVWNAIRTAAIAGKFGLKFAESEPGVLKYVDEDSQLRYKPEAMIIVAPGSRWSEDALDAKVLRGPASALSITVEVEEGSR